MNSVIELYAFLNRANEIAIKIDSVSREDFLNNEEMVSAFYGIFKELITYLVKLDNVLMMHSELNILVREIYEVDRFMLNSYKLINADMLYDFYKVDYKRLNKIVNELVK